MKQNTRRLFSLLLALVMALCLAVPAFADEGDQPEKELRWVHLDWDENGKAYARDDVLKNDDPGEWNSTEYDLSRQDGVLFFIWNNKTNKREGYVVPKAGDGLLVEKLDKEGVASNAKQSQYYVTLRMTKFQDSEVTASGLSFKVIAKLGDFGYYSAETPSAETILGDQVEAAELNGDTLYFCAPYMGTNEAAERGAVVKVEKDPNTPDFNKCYDIENVKDGVWKLTLNDAGKIQLKNGGIWLNLKLEVKDPDGNTREEWRSININGEGQGPQLWFVHLNDEWDDMGNQTFFTGENVWAECQTAQVHTGDYAKYGIFGTIKDGQDLFTEKGFNQDAFTPVDVKDLKTPAGLTVESVSGQARRGEKWGKYFVRVSVAENGREYKVTSGDYAITIDSGLPEVGVYSAPTASFDTWAGEYEHPYHPARADNTYYIISTATDDGINNRHLTGAKLSTANLNDGCGNALVSLDKVSDNVYKLTIKDTSRSRFHVELDLTWTDFMGSTWTDANCGFGDFWLAPSIVASATKLTDKYDEFLPYAEAAGKASTSVTMNAGEQKQVYLYTTPLRPDGMTLRAYGETNAALFHSSDGAMTIAFDKNEPAKFTLSASKAGTYDIFVGRPSWDEVKLFHADGTPYTEKETEAWNNDPSFYVDTDPDGKMIIWGADQDYTDAVPFEEYFNGDTCEIVFGDVEDLGFQHLTVTVTGEAKTFTDVKSSDWFAPAVQYVCGRGLMNGTDKGFEPAREVYNTEMLQILWNMAGNPKADTNVSAAAGQWYAGAVNWAASVKLVDGTAFTGQKLITRGEVRELMDAYGKLVSKDYSNLFKGNESGDLMLDKTLTRCELAQVLTNAKA